MSTIDPSGKEIPVLSSDTSDFAKDLLPTEQKQFRIATRAWIAITLVCAFLSFLLSGINPIGGEEWIPVAAKWAMYTFLTFAGIGLAVYAWYEIWKWNPNRFLHLQVTILLVLAVAGLLFLPLGAIITIVWILAWIAALSIFDRIRLRFKQ